MAHISTAWGDVVTALVTGLRVLPGYRSPWEAGGDGIPVYDSAEYLLTSDLSPTVLVVGHVGDGGALTEAGQAPQRVAVLGTTRGREEEGTVNCLVSASTGDFQPGAVPAVRDAALDVLDAVDAYLRRNPTLGLVPAYRHVEARLDGIPGIRPVPTTDGPEMELDFTVAYSARI